MTSGPAEAQAGASIATGTVLRAQQESIESLRELARLARHVIASNQHGASEFSGAFDAECIGCGIRISGAELLQIADEAGGGLAADSKVDRLRKGYCARRTCESRFYEIRCIARPGVDWQSVLAMKDGYVSAPETIMAEAEVAPSAGALLRSKIFFAGGLAAGLILLLVIAFQYWAGGRIPFLREPANFELDPAATQWYNELKEASAAEN